VFSTRRTLFPNESAISLLGDAVNNHSQDFPLCVCEVVLIFQRGFFTYGFAFSNLLAKTFDSGTTEIFVAGVDLFSALYEFTLVWYPLTNNHMHGVQGSEERTLQSRA
jgi:hypothetical protein